MTWTGVGLGSWALLTSNRSRRLRPRWWHLPLGLASAGPVAHSFAKLSSELTAWVDDAAHTRGPAAPFSVGCRGCGIVSNWQACPHAQSQPA